MKQRFSHFRAAEEFAAGAEYIFSEDNMPAGVWSSTLVLDQRRPRGRTVGSLFRILSIFKILRIFESSDLPTHCEMGELF